MSSGIRLSPQVSAAAAMALSMMVTSLAVSDAVYEWRDADGVAHLADTPPPDQEGVELLRVNGKTVNTFHQDPVAESETTAPPTIESAASRVPRDEADCEQIHGRPCNWDEHWRRYAGANCARVGDEHCGDDAHLRAHHDPRVHAQRHAARGAHHR